MATAQRHDGIPDSLPTRGPVRSPSWFALNRRPPTRRVLGPVEPGTVKPLGLNTRLYTYRLQLSCGHLVVRVLQSGWRPQAVARRRDGACGASSFAGQEVACAACGDHL